MSKKSFKRHNRKYTWNIRKYNSSIRKISGKKNVERSEIFLGRNKIPTLEMKMCKKRFKMIGIKDYFLVFKGNKLKKWPLVDS